MKNNLLKIVKKALVTLLAAMMVLFGSIAFTSTKASAAIPTVSSPNKTVMLIPLDDRPINYDTVQKAAASSGLKIILPPKDIIATELQDKTDGTGSHGGNPTALINWIEAHKSEADGYIISADQLHSGGLVESRSLKPEISTDQGKANLDIIQELKEDFPNKPIYVFDTVMRLASTAEYEGLDTTKYTQFRRYGGVPRKVLTSFSISSVKAAYNQDANGNPIPLSGTSPIDNGNYSISQSERDQYLAAKSRKLDLNYKVIQEAAYADYTVFGVDDSNPKNTVQTNEINWLNFHIANTIGSTKSAIVSDADGISLNLLARMTKELYSQPSIKYHVQWFGADGATKQEPYHFESTLGELLKTQITISGGSIVTDKNSADVSLLVLSPDSINRASLVSTYNSNMSSIIPTTVIDLKDSHADDYIMGNIVAGGNVSRMLAYSAWNTAGNRMGIALGTGGSRFNFMRYETNPTKLREATNAFVSLNIDRIIDDYEYKATRQKDTIAKIQSFGGNTANMKTNMTEAQIKQVDDFELASMRNAQATIESQFATHRVMEKVNGLRSFDWVIVDSVPVLYDEDVALPWNRYFDLTVNTGAASVH